MWSPRVLSFITALLYSLTVWWQDVQTASEALREKVLHAYLGFQYCQQSLEFLSPLIPHPNFWSTFTWLSLSISVSKYSSLVGDQDLIRMWSIHKACMSFSPKFFIDQTNIGKKRFIWLKCHEVCHGKSSGWKPRGRSWEHLLPPLAYAQSAFLHNAGLAAQVWHCSQ